MKIQATLKADTNYEDTPAYQQYATMLASARPSSALSEIPLPQANTPDDPSTPFTSDSLPLSPHPAPDG